MATRKVTINRENKDRLFNFIFGRKENQKWTLQLYNAVNHSNYRKPDEIKFNTLDNFLYVSMKNDTSFIFAGCMNLFEHQSTYNPNMPLRLMQYIAQLYDRYIAENKLDKYGKTLIELPVPRLVVFYNGEDSIQDEVTLRLSDSFDERLRKKSDIEVTVKMLNINAGHNKELMGACKPLSEYSWFVERIKQNNITNSLEDSVTLAIQAMPDSFEIKAFLKAHMAEVNNMLQMEYQEKNAKDLIAKANFKKGKEEGKKEGADKHLIQQICKKLSKGKDADTIADELEEELSVVQEIVDIAEAYAPVYDADKVFEEYCRSKEPVKRGN